MSYETIAVDLAAGEQKKPEFLALNPNGKVPTRVVDGTLMFEALAIMQWLGDRFGVERGLWPAADAPEQVEALSWTTWSYVTYGTQVMRLNYAQSENSPAALHHPAHAAHALDELQSLLAILDARPNLLGETFTLAEHNVASVVTYSTYCGVSVDDHPPVADWLARFRARPSFSQIWG